MKYTIRTMHAAEYPLLEELLYLALYQPANTPPVPFSAIYKPEIYIYIHNFGTMPTDMALVAQLDSGEIAGAVWTRILAGPVPGYGNVDAETPEFAIALRPRYRGQGVGTALMQAACRTLKAQGYARATLSVDKANYAVKLYRKVGFTTLEEREHDYLMEIAFR